jgi:ribonuclease Z
MALQVPSTSLTLPAEGGGSFTLKGRSRAGDGTTFLLPELKWMFDFGAMVHQGKPDVACLTHTHNDHITFMAQILVDRSRHIDVYLPAKALPFVEKYLEAHQHMSDCGEETGEDGEKKNYTLHPVDFGETFTITIKRTTYTVTVLECDHRVVCLGLSIYRRCRVRKPEYEDLTGPELGELRKRGVSPYDSVDLPFLCYLGDTTHIVFERHPEILQQHKYIVVECSFYCEKTREKAKTSKHMHWDQLKTIVEAHPTVLFILTHFSLRYSGADIRKFFVKETATTRNVHPMLVESEIRPNRSLCNCFHCREQQHQYRQKAKRGATDDGTDRPRQPHHAHRSKQKQGNRRTPKN